MVAGGRCGWWLGLWLITACGRLGFEPMGANGDDAAIDANGDAAGDASPACTAFGAWGTPRHLAEINESSDDWAPTLSPDRLELYFTTTRGGGPSEIYRAVRAMPGDPFGPATRVVLDDNYEEPTLTDDALTIWFMRHPSGGVSDLYTATRSSPQAAWPGAQSVVGLSEPLVFEAAPAIRGDGLALALSSDVAGTDDVYIAPRADPGSAWSAPVVQPQLATAANECCASYGEDGSLYFVREIGGDGRIYRAAFDGQGGGFLTPATVPATRLATGAEGNPALSRDGLSMVYDSTASGGMGARDLVEIERPCLSP